MTWSLNNNPFNTNPILWIIPSKYLSSAPTSLHFYCLHQIPALPSDLASWLVLPSLIHTPQHSWSELLKITFWASCSPAQNLSIWSKKPKLFFPSFQCVMLFLTPGSLHAFFSVLEGLQHPTYSFSTYLKQHSSQTLLGRAFPYNLTNYYLKYILL